MILYSPPTMLNLRTPFALLSLALMLAACGKTAITLPSGKTPAGQSGSKTVESRASLEARANKGDAAAQFELGAIYHDGDGVPKDTKKAIGWFQKSAAGGDVRAQFNLGVMYYLGEGVQQDYVKARDLFTKAVQQNNPRAEFNLGVIYYRGEGVPVDLAKARDLFTKAAMMNFGEAQFNLGVMDAKGEAGQVDIGKAYAWFVLSRENGSPKADGVIKTIEPQFNSDQRKLTQKMVAALKVAVQQTMKSATK